MAESIMKMPGQCPICAASGFPRSITGKGCEFCDGTFGGNPPKKLKYRVYAVDRAGVVREPIDARAATALAQTGAVIVALEKGLREILDVARARMTSEGRTGEWITVEFLASDALMQAEVASNPEMFHETRAVPHS